MLRDKSVFQLKEYIESRNSVYNTFNIDDVEYIYSIKNSILFINRVCTQTFITNDIIKQIFAKFPKINKIVFSSTVNKSSERISNAIYKYGLASNFISLPETQEIFIDLLGKKTRQHIKYYKRRLNKMIPNNRIVHFKNNCPDDVIAEIVHLNYLRCRINGFNSGTNLKLLLNVCKFYGNITCIMKDENILAGTISLLYNGVLFLVCIAHKNIYGNLNLGNIVLIETINKAIKDKYIGIELGWGAVFYKKQFNGMYTQLYDITVYKEKSSYIKIKTEDIIKGLLVTIKKCVKKILKKLLPYNLIKYLKKIKKEGLFKNKGYILILHRVADKDNNKLNANENMKVSPDFLDKQLKILKEKFDIIDISDIENRIKTKHKKKFIVFTLDDGYKDNLYEALPVFKKHNVPFTVFTVSDFINQKAILWWYELEDLILQNTEIKLANGKVYQCNTKKEKENSFLRIREDILILDQNNLKNELNNLFENYNIDWCKKNTQLCLNKDELLELSNESLVTIGGHTKHHLNLKMLPTDESVYEEISLGINELENIIQKKIKYFAYPFGSKNEVSEREIEISNKIIPKMSFTAFSEKLNKRNLKNMHRIPRVPFTENFKFEDLI